jgi:DNA-binding NtrC family response regulator
VALADDGQTITSQDLAPGIAAPWNDRPVASTRTSDPGVHVGLDQTLAAAIEDLEEKFIQHALASTGGRVADAARLLGLSRKGLFLKRRRRRLIAD